MDEKIIKVASFFDYTQAEIAKIALEAEGIECFLSGENFVATYWLYANADGGIKLYIKESEKERAEAILKATHKPDETDKDTSYDLRCPKCNSSDIRNTKYYLWFSVIVILYLALLSPFLLILGLPLILLLSNRCRNCGYKWK